MAEGTPAPQEIITHWTCEHDSGYVTTTPNSDIYANSSPDSENATRSSMHLPVCISSTPAEQNVYTPGAQNSAIPYPVLPKRSFTKMFKNSFLSLSDLENGSHCEDPLSEPYIAESDNLFIVDDEGFQEVFEDMQVEEVVCDKMRTEEKPFIVPVYGRQNISCTRSGIKGRCVSYVGKEKVDFLALLGELNNYTPILNIIYKYLSAEDLVNISLVCKAWWKICRADKNVQTRVTKYLEKINKDKENQPKKLKTTFAWSSTPRRYFVEIQNLNRERSSRPVSASSPPVSPSKVRFHQFFKAAQKLEDGKTLAPCPRCSLPSLIDSVSNVGQCTREGCRYIFCCLCHCESHGKQPCSALMLAPRSRKRLGSIGSRDSKRNLRRL